MRFDFFTLKLFVALAEERSIAGAAAREHVVASAASKRLAQLEGDFGVTLFVRHAKGVDLTPAGTALLQRARDILRSIEATEHEVADYAQDGFAHVRLVANHSSLVQFLPGDLAAFLDVHPRVKIDLAERFSVDVARVVGDGVADVGIFCSPAAPTGLAVLPYRRDELVLVVPRGHPLAGGGDVAFRDTLPFEFVGFFPNLLIESVYPAVASRSRSRVRVQIVNFDATCRMVRAGLGVALVPVGSAQPHLADGGLVLVHLSDPWVHRQSRICFRDGDEGRPGVRDLAAFLAGRAAADAGPAPDGAGR
jgi:DNA-binding transcriptional LysR family regulator